MHTLARRTLSTAVILSTALLSFPAAAQEQQYFPDVGKDHECYGDVQNLRSVGFVQGLSDGTFAPEQLLNRAESLGFILKPLIPADQVNALATSGFGDVTPDQWYDKYATAAVKRGVIKGPSERPNFEPTRTVIRAEFLRMALDAHGIDLKPFVSVEGQISDDVTRDQWYDSYMRTAVGLSLISFNPEDGRMHPAEVFTRCDAAKIINGIVLYKKGYRNNTIINYAKAQMIMTINAIEKEEPNVLQADFASTRGELLGLGAYINNPDHPLTRGMYKATQGYRKLFIAFRLGLDESHSGDPDVTEYEKVISIAQEAWKLGAEALAGNEDNEVMRDQIVGGLQGRAGAVANHARSLINPPVEQ